MILQVLSLFIFIYCLLPTFPLRSSLFLSRHLFSFHNFLIYIDFFWHSCFLVINQKWRNQRGSINADWYKNYNFIFSSCFFEYKEKCRVTRGDRGKIVCRGQNRFSISAHTCPFRQPVGWHLPRIRGRLTFRILSFMYSFSSLYFYKKPRILSSLVVSFPRTRREVPSHARQ